MRHPEAPDPRSDLADMTAWARRSWSSATVPERIIYVLATIGAAWLALTGLAAAVGLLA